MTEKKYHVITYGCQMNEFDTEVYSKFLEEMGYAETKSPEDADILVFNTCAVRENADKRLYGRLGQAVGWKRNRPDMVIAVCGCVARKDGQSMADRFSHIDLVSGPGDIASFKDNIIEILEGKTPVVSVSSTGDELDLSASRKSSVSAWVPVSAGCDLKCAYCIVPYVRGDLRSRQPENILKEVRELVDGGFKEIILLGQNVNRYGLDLKPRVKFSELIREIGGIDKDFRLRFVSPYPKGFTKELIAAMTEVPQVCEHIHLPLQAGDDNVLKRMRRGYTGEEFVKLVADLRAAIPGLSITTDIIVGFPGETGEQFENTMKLVEEAMFDNAFMFAYSARAGTEAAKMEDQVPHEEIMQRLYRLIEVQNSIMFDKNSAFLGKTVEVLVEGPSKKDPSRMTGRTRDNRVVVLEGETFKPGEVVFVKIDKTFLWGLKGSRPGG
ncbi:MAG: tRNA (N6-isopentenyl adenosine(37)-C2)-methylthiotransferase MiaB [Chloroflexi bacterium]|nr:tRNA (N6-isopentenyl adenosine(37)-C2)-methylthiotransferase MiaB [Chloroflexota bacterium]